jgi:hypothetical protein
LIVALLSALIVIAVLLFLIYRKLEHCRSMLFETGVHLERFFRAHRILNNLPEPEEIEDWELLAKYEKIDRETAEHIESNEYRD